MFINTLNSVLHTLFFHPRLRLLRRGQLFVALGVFAYMALSSSPGVWTSALSDKLLHFLGNLLLIGSIWVAFFGSINGRLAILFAVIYSLTIESFQALTTMRHPDLFDAAANLLGIFVGFGVCRLSGHYILRLEARKAELEE